MTLPMPSSGTCGQVRGRRSHGCPDFLPRWDYLPSPNPLGLCVPPGAPSPAHGAHQGVVKVEGADVVGRNVSGSQGTCDLGHNPTFI